jgi:hypothetical protein
MASNEGRIRRLCSDLLAKRSDEDFEPLIVELRDALHQHIEDLRESLGSYPLHVEAAAAGESRRQARVLKRRIA